MDFTVQIGIVILKAALAMGLLLHLAALATWVERKGSALIQDRVGANRASIFGFDLAGIINTLVADPVKAILKEDFVPKGVSIFLHAMGPFLAVVPVIASLAVIPFGPPLVFGGQEITLQVANLDAGVLFVFAMGSLAVYGVVIAGWVGNNKFSLLGGLRASAQMVSYEITMGLSIVGLLVAYGTLDLGEIVRAQSGTVFGFLPKWGIFLCPPFNIIAFLLFFTSMMAETKRAPFDLPESESELVAGYLTEYSGMKFLLFWLGEFSEIVIASCLVSVLFFGGWQLPYYDVTAIPSDLGGAVPWLANAAPSWFGWVRDVNWQWGCLVGFIVFGAKVSFFSVLQIFIRWTLPRFRYDQLMNLCWKLMLPVALANVLLTVAWIISEHS